MLPSCSARRLSHWHTLADTHSTVSRAAGGYTRCMAGCRSLTRHRRDISARCRAHSGGAAHGQCLRCSKCGGANPRRRPRCFRLVDPRYTCWIARLPTRDVRASRARQGGRDNTNGDTGRESAHGPLPSGRTDQIWGCDRVGRGTADHGLEHLASRATPAKYRDRHAARHSRNIVGFSAVVRSCNRAFPAR